MREFTRNEAETEENFHNTERYHCIIYRICSSYISPGTLFIIAVHPDIG